MRLTKTANLLSLIGFIALTPTLACADDLDEAKLANDAKIPLAQAIEIAEQNAGGKAFQASLDDDRFDAAYEVDVAVGDKVREVWVSAEDGKVLDARDDADDKAVQPSLALADVVRAAEGHKSAKAFEAECDDDRFDDNCEVSVVTTANEVFDVVVDGTSGKVIRTRQDKDDD